MSLASAAVERSTVTWFCAGLVLVVGLVSFFSLGQLEDPEFAIKSAHIVTAYPGASAQEVEDEVTDPIETALQEIAEVDYIKSTSQDGLSTVKVEMRAEFWADALPQIFDSVRRKIRDVEGSLPDGAGRPMVNDEVGDVYGFVLALTSDGFSEREMEDYAELIRNRFLAIEGVSRVEYWGIRDERVYVDYRRSRLANLGLTESSIAQTLSVQGSIVDAGRVDIGSQRIRVQPTGGFDDPDDIANLVIRPELGDLLSMGAGGSLAASEIIRLEDVGTVRRGYVDPPSTRMRFNGRHCVGIAISNQPGVNIVNLGQRIDAELAAVIGDLPVGLELEKVHWQSDVVSEAVNGFLESFGQAVVIVLIVITAVMGWRMGIIIGTALVLTIAGSFILMAFFGIDLQRMSLGALVIALGMMVDNAIVVADGTYARIAKGMDRRKAAIEAGTQPAMPLLGATLIAVMAFYPIYASVEGAGEYCASLFTVVAISLLTSWVISVTVTPLQCIWMLKSPEEGEESKDPYGSGFYQGFKRLLLAAIRFRAITIGSMVALLVSSGVAFSFVTQLFFPDSSMQKFMMDFWAPEGQRLEVHDAQISEVEGLLVADDRVDSVTSFIGRGPPRFYLPVESESPNPSYGQLIVNVRDFREIDAIIADVNARSTELLPGSLVITRKYGVGPSNTYKFALRITGPTDADPDILRELAEEVRAVLKRSPLVAYSTTDWRQRTPIINPVFDQERGSFANVTRQDVAEVTKRTFDGSVVGVFRDGDKQIPIVLRNADEERQTFEGLNMLPVQPFLSDETIPMAQVIDNIDLKWEDPLIQRRNRLRTITVQANPIPGETLPSMMKTVQAEIEALEFPPGYTMEWGGETESSADSQASLIPGMIPAGIVVIVTLIALFNAYRPPLVILLTVPFAVIGVAYGLLLTGTAFGFVALLGAMSLCGMMIKNAIVLLDEINLLKSEGQEPLDATVNAALSRLRPVMLAAATTVLGVIPLLSDVFWVGLAATVMAGLSFGTLLTMFLVPVFYATFFKIKVKQ